MLLFLRWLSTPFPMAAGTMLKLALGGVVGIVTFLILAIFRPFSLHTVEEVTYLAGFGLNAGVSVLIHYFVGEPLLPRFYDEQRWTIGRQLLLIASITMMVAMANYVYNSTIGLHISPQYGPLAFVYMTSMVAVLPGLIMIYATETIARRRNQDRALLIDTGRHPDHDTSLLVITSENSTEPPFSISAKDFLFASAANNYVEIAHLIDDQVSYTLLRLKLKALEEQVADYPNLLRCHKSYLINRQHITSSQGNARSMTVTLLHVGLKIPVSRSFDRHLLRTEGLPIGT